MSREASAPSDPSLSGSTRIRRASLGLWSDAFVTTDCTPADGRILSKKARAMKSGCRQRRCTRRRAELSTGPHDGPSPQSTIRVHGSHLSPRSVGAQSTIHNPSSRFTLLARGRTVLSPQSTIRVHGSNGCLEVKFTVRGWSSLFKQASVLNPQSTIRVHGSHFSPEGGRCSVHNPQSEFTVQAFLWHRPQGRPVQIHGSSSQFELLQGEGTRTLGSNPRFEFTVRAFTGGGHSRAWFKSTVQVHSSHRPVWQGSPVHKQSRIQLFYR